MNEQDMKTCPTCGEIKPVDMFHKSKRDGIQNGCKACRNAHNRRWYKRGGKECYKTPAAKATKSRWKKSKIGKVLHRKSNKRHRQKWPEREKARKAINNAVRAKELPPATTCTCLQCGSQAESRHHYLGYAEEHWLDVIELCNPCHTKIDTKE